MDGAEELAAEDGRRTAVGRALRAGRLALGLTQKALAKKADVGYSTLRGVEENTDEGKQHTPPILKALSLALDQPVDYLSNIQKGQPGQKGGDIAEDRPPGVTSDEPEATDSVALRSFLDAVAPRLDEIVVARLNEIVVPRLDKIDVLEGQVHTLMDVIFSPEREVEIDVDHPAGRHSPRRTGAPSQDQDRPRP
jgi:transcriptional regulator with XRE-family HTH domain